MRAKVDVRQDMSIVLDRARALVEALKALPDTVEALQAASQRLSVQERAQLVEVLGLLSYHGYQMYERSVWLKRTMAGPVTPVKG